MAWSIRIVTETVFVSLFSFCVSMFRCKQFALHLLDCLTIYPCKAEVKQKDAWHVDLFCEVDLCFWKWQKRRRFGRHGINFHYGGDNNTWSEGCQTFTKTQWDEFQKLVYRLMDLYKLTAVKYLLVENAK
jgi:hypothetical protein